MRIGIDIDNVISNFNEELLNEYINHDKKLRDTGIINKNADYIRRGIYPIIHKVDSDYFYSNCDIANKKNNSEFDYLYAEVEDGFIGIGQYNNIFSSYKVDTENEIIRQLLNINVLSKNVSEDMLMKYVIDDRKEKDFEMII